MSAGYLIAHLSGYCHMSIDQIVHLTGMARQMADTAVMGEEGMIWTVTHQPVQRGMCRNRIKLYWRSGRKHEFHSIHVEFTVGDAECVAGGEGTAPFIENAIVMKCMARSMEK